MTQDQDHLIDSTPGGREAAKGNPCHADISTSPIITPSDIRNAIKNLSASSIPPGVIKTAKEAREATRNDPLGRKWKVGDEYFRFLVLGKKITYYR